MLNILKQVDLRKFERGGEIFHYMVEAKRLAFEAMAGIFADPDFAEMPIDELLSESFAKRLFERIKTDSVITPERLAVPLQGEGDTTYLTVVDGNGMMVSLIHRTIRVWAVVWYPQAWALCCRTEVSSFRWSGHRNVYAPDSGHSIRSSPLF